MCQIRSKVAQFASAMDLTSAQVADIKLAVGEAVTNAVKHGSNNGRCTVSVAARKCRDTFLVRISDHGLGFDPATIVEAGCSLDESGRGIMCMKAVMDEVRIRSGKHGTEVTLIKKLR